MMLTISPEQATIKLETWCAKAEHCSAEALKKLKGWGISSTEANGIVDRLKERRFIDDDRFARAYARDKFRFSGWGRLKIKTALRAMSIPQAIIADALSEIEESDYQRIVEHLIKKKLRTLSPELTPYEKKQRLLRFGLSRGFEPQLLVRAINGILNNS